MSFCIVWAIEQCQTSKERWCMCSEFIYIGRPMAGLDGPSGICMSSQELFKNNSLIPPSSLSPSSFSSPQGKGKKKKKEIIQFQNAVIFRAPYTEQEHLTETSTWTCLWGGRKDYQMPVFLSWSHTLLLLVKTVKQYLQGSAQHEVGCTKHGRKEFVLYTTVQPSGAESKRYHSSTKPTPSVGF